MVASPHLEKLRDLTEKLEKKDRALVAAKKTLDSFFDLALDMLSVTDFDGKFKKVNSAWTDSLGWTQEELLSTPFVEFVHPDDRQDSLNKFSKIVNAGDKAIYFRNRYRCKDGTYKILCWTAVADPSSSLVYAIARDFTAMMERVTE